MRNGGDPNTQEGQVPHSAYHDPKDGPLAWARELKGPLSLSRLQIDSAGF